MKKTNLPNYIRILRPDHWFKNAVVLFGSFAAVFYLKIDVAAPTILTKALLATFLACIVSSVNYIVNDIADKKGDSLHPVKKNRLIPSKKVSVDFLYVMASILLITSLGLSEFFFGRVETMALSLLFIAGILYNIKPIRLKDLPILDVVSESANNPIRIIIGWFALTNSSVFPPAILLLFFWSAGAVLMTAKRYVELKFFTDLHQKKSLILYRSSFETYTTSMLFTMVIFFLALTLLFFTFFAASYKPSLLILLPILIGYSFWFLLLTEDKDYILKEPESVITKNTFFSSYSLLILLVLFILVFYY